MCSHLPTQAGVYPGNIIHSYGAWGSSQLWLFEHPSKLHIALGRVRDLSEMDDHYLNHRSDPILSLHHSGGIPRLGKYHYTHGETWTHLFRCFSYHLFECNPQEPGGINRKQVGQELVPGISHSEGR
jgi:hypothetical protein